MRATTIRRVALVLAWALACACTPPSEEETTTRRPRSEPALSVEASEPVATVSGGSVVVAVADEPTTLSPWSVDPDGPVGMMLRPMLAPLWRLRPDGTAEPWLLAEAPAVRGGSNGEPFTVTYRIRQDAVWSDGHPIDGGDLLFTLEQCTRVVPHDDCAAVDLERSSASGKQAVVAFDRPLAGWTAVMASRPVLPEHVLRNRDPATAWDRRVSVSSGPFRFASWASGDNLVLVRNERWWGETAALDRIEFRFGAPADVATVADGAVDVALMPATPPTVDAARADRRLRTEVAAGSHWLALDFNLATPLLQRREIRRALAGAIDRDTIVAEMIAPLSPRTGVLSEPPGGPAADDQTLSYPVHDAAAAARQLDAAGCPPGEDGTRACDGQPLVFDLVTGADDWQHSIIAEYLRSHLGRIGVAVTIPDAAASEPGGADGPGSPSQAAGVAATEPPDDGSVSWDLRVTAVPTYADPAAGGQRWQCDHPANTQSFCAPRYDTFLQRAAAAIDDDQRTDLEEQAALELSREVPTYPLYEMPALLVRSAGVRGPTLNATAWGPTWNVEVWARTTN